MCVAKMMVKLLEINRNFENVSCCFYHCQLAEKLNAKNHTTSVRQMEVGSKSGRSSGKSSSFNSSFAVWSHTSI
jgi:hypothetical protein